MLSNLVLILGLAFATIPSGFEKAFCVVGQGSSQVVVGRTDQMHCPKALLASHACSTRRAAMASAAKGRLESSGCRSVALRVVTPAPSVRTHDLYTWSDPVVLPSRFVVPEPPPAVGVRQVFFKKNQPILDRGRPPDLPRGPPLET